MTELRGSSTSVIGPDRHHPFERDDGTFCLRCGVEITLVAQLVQACPGGDVWEVERDRFGVVFSGPLEVGECRRVVDAALVVERARLREALDRLLQAIAARQGGSLEANYGSLRWRLAEYDELLAAVEAAATVLDTTTNQEL